MTRPFLTVLTSPVLDTPTRLYRGLRRAARPIVKPHAPLPAPWPYPGHTGLVRSVVDGLRAIKADFNFNPDRYSAIGEAVYAPANEALAQAITLKQHGRITLLVAGPANAFIPSECDSILMAPEIDVVIVASEWVRAFYQTEAPALNDKVRVCPAGVDVQYWAPAATVGGETATPGNAVVYWKSGDEAFCGEVEQVVKNHGLAPTRVRYGAYESDGFKRALSGAPVGVFLSGFETQGLALAEAWAMNVPTLAWDPRAVTAWNGHSFTAGSSCPYLTPATGHAWQTLPELDAALHATLTSPSGVPNAAAAWRAASYAPRDWVLSHMTDAICSAALYRIIQDAASAR